MSKLILLVDFDGVIHSYTSGWQGVDVIPDPPVSGALQFLRKATEHFEVCIYSARSCDTRGIKAMVRWLLEWVEKEGLDNPELPPEATQWYDGIRFPSQKPSAFLTIDDRAICFTGTFPDPQELLGFQPWYKRD